jgi:hypothetical protein
MTKRKQTKGQTLIDKTLLVYDVIIVCKIIKKFIIISLNVTCSHHDIAANLLIWRYITTIHPIVILLFGNMWLTSGMVVCSSWIWFEESTLTVTPPMRLGMTIAGIVIITAKFV